MEFVIITGLSGAGKTSALHAMEDIGYYCVDNIPPLLLDTFYELCDNSADSRMKKVAVVADMRSGKMFSELTDVISKCKIAGKRFKMLFLDTKADTLLIRYKETRRKHPLSSEFANGSIEEAVNLEVELMKPVKIISDYVIDTSYMTPKQLKERVSSMFSQGMDTGMIITCMSFGFKYGIPLEADLIFDVRCLPNPFYIKELKHKTGLDEEVRQYVLDFDVTQKFVDKLLAFLDMSLPLYKEEGKSELVIGIGCTGGKHRSVTLTRLLNSHFNENNYQSSIHHRDIWKA